RRKQVVQNQERVILDDVIDDLNRAKDGGRIYAFLSLQGVADDHSLRRNPPPDRSARRLDERIVDDPRGRITRQMDDATGVDLPLLEPKPMVADAWHPARPDQRLGPFVAK